jgi:hypothetical protein
MADMTEEEKAVLLRVLDRRGEAAAKRWEGFEHLLPCAESGLDFLHDEEILDRIIVEKQREQLPLLAEQPRKEEPPPLPDIIHEEDAH